jgi:hypothetical protein
MSNDLRDLVDGEAELDDEEDDESFDEDTGESRQKPKDHGMDDSSEEEDDDEDEEEARKVCQFPRLSNFLLLTDHRFAKDSLSTKRTRTTKPRTTTHANVARRRSGVGPSAKKSSTKKILI